MYHHAIKGWHRTFTLLPGMTVEALAIRVLHLAYRAYRVVHSELVWHIGRIEMRYM